MNHQSTIFIAGHPDVKQHAIVEYLKSEGYRRLVTSEDVDLDMLNRQAVDDFFKEYRPEHVIVSSMAPQEEGGREQRPAEYLFMNMVVHSHVIDAD